MKRKTPPPKKQKNPKKTPTKDKQTTIKKKHLTYFQRKPKYSTNYKHLDNLNIYEDTPVYPQNAKEKKSS